MGDLRLLPPRICICNLQSLPYCNTIARPLPLRNIRPPTDHRSSQIFSTDAIYHTILCTWHMAISCKGQTMTYGYGIWSAYKYAQNIFQYFSISKLSKLNLAKSEKSQSNDQRLPISFNININISYYTLYIYINTNNLILCIICIFNMAVIIL